MKHTCFYRLGEWIHQGRLVIVVFFLAIFGLCLPLLPQLLTPFQSTGFVNEEAESTKTLKHLDETLGFSNKNQIMVLYHSAHLLASHDEYHEKIKQSLAHLKHFPIAHDVIYPKDATTQISKDGHTAYALIVFKGTKPLSAALLKRLKHDIITPKHMTLKLGGDPVFMEAMNQQTQKDLYQADKIAAPVSMVVLVLVFGSLVAAFLPMLLGGGCALLILTLLFFWCQFTGLSIFTVNIALLLGLCLSMDYALFMIYRFRTELSHGYAVIDAIAITLATAGRAVFYSGLAVFVSLSALLFFPINVLFSIGAGGLTAVFVSVVFALFLLPAILSMLGNNINRFAVPSFSWMMVKKGKNNGHFWRWMASVVVKRPLLFFVIILALLLCFGYPFLQVRLGLSNFHMLPKHSESRHFFDDYKKSFNEQELTPIMLVVQTQHDSILKPKAIGALYHLVHKILKNPNVAEVKSIVTLKPPQTLSSYKKLYALPAAKRPLGVKQLLRHTTKDGLTVVYVVSRFGPRAPETQQLMLDLEQMKHRHLRTKLAGVPVEQRDVFQAISSIFPYVMAWVVVLTYTILLFLLRSLFLPLKAIFMNVLSLCASYGVLVFVFQEGHGHQWLNFEPQGMLDISLLIIIFCAIFGFSMDYEVFLLTRIQESYRKTKDNCRSIIFGIEQSSRIITSAALIVICLCGSFMVADVLMVKEFGLGIAVAIFVDAFLIRTLLVPSTMALIKSWNWYLPKWLHRLFGGF